ncbi:MAG: DNA gyrase subunit A [Eubacteriales bacterium]|nr:DNA gyrase subunit A [Eubacteriales bacterium]
MADESKNLQGQGKLPKTSAQIAKEREAEVDFAFRKQEQTIIPVNLEEEMRQSFIDYAMSVITDRAIPDIRDGLKPVHRRILYSMQVQGFTPDKPYRKCATTVGDVIGHYHPHGDAAVYDAMVRLAQDFSMRYPLVDGHGNFGSRDGDPPAAYRYTEARLQKLASQMMLELNKDTVDFQLNFSEEVMEPEVFPAGFPNLLVNGSTGIAVGMTTNIPPHNLNEVVDATIHLIDNPDATADDLMEILPGPDFPTYGMILGTSGIRAAYRSGRGRIIVRAHCEVEEMPHGRYRIVVHDLPYMVNKARLIERIAEQVKDKRIEGISDIRDESDRSEAVRIVIELKRDATPTVVLNQLYKHTQLQDSFSVNMLALVKTEDGHLAPKLVNLPEALSHFVNHQSEVITRRTKFDLENAAARRHIVEGLMLALDRIDEVIATIRASKNGQEAKQNLMEKFGFSERQAQHVGDMRLWRLSGLERDKVKAEHAELCEKIAYYESILADRNLLMSIMKEELTAVKNRFGDERRTSIELGMFGDVDDESLIEEEQIVVTMSNAGYIKRMPTTVYASQHRGGRGIAGMQTRDEDFVDTILTTSTHDYLLFFTNKGRVFHLKGYQIPESGRQARGMAIVNLLQLHSDESISSIVPIASMDLDGNLLFATRQGLVKKTGLKEYININRAGLIAISLREGDEVVTVRLVEKGADVVLVTREGMSIHFNAGDVRRTGRNTMGVRGINLRPGDRVIGMVVAEPEETLLVVSEKGLGKRSRICDYRLQGRGGKGLITYRMNERSGKLIAAAIVTDEQDLLLINDLGIIIRIHVSEIPVMSRNTLGVSLMRCPDDSQVVDLAVVEREEDSEAEVEVEAVEALSEAEAAELAAADLDLDEPSAEAELAEDSEPLVDEE